MHILFLTDNFPPEYNAAASRVYERACYWIKWGHRVTVITSCPNAPTGRPFPGYKNHWFQKEQFDGISVIRVKTYMAANQGIVRRIFDHLSFMCTAWIAGLFYQRPDIILATSPQFFTMVAGWGISIVKRCPFVAEISDLWPASIQAVGILKSKWIFCFLEKLELFLYHQASKIIVLSPSFKENLVQRNIPIDKINVVINGVNLTEFYPQVKNNQLQVNYDLQNKIIFGYIGTHGMAHGLSNILSAAKILKNHDHIHFLFVGDGAEKSKLLQIKLEKKLSNVTFLAAQPKNQILQYWNLCDFALIHLKNHAVFAGVLPSKLFEAMAVGLPLIFVGPAGVASELIRDYQNGLIIPPENSQQLAHTILKISQGEYPIQTWKNHSLKKVIYHTREKQAAEFLQIISLIKK